MTTPHDVSILLELHYLGTVQYFSKFASGYPVVIEQHESYVKGSFRNRCYILGANGKLRLSIPLIKGKHEKMPIRDVRIAYDSPWQKVHWRGILSAYGKSPFFNHYKDELSPFYEKRYPFLFDFNLELIQSLLKIIGIDSEVTLSDSFVREVKPGVRDLRNLIHPKKNKVIEDSEWNSVRYPQVFESRSGFVPNLSIIDLLFCCGPESIMVLKNSYQNS